MSEPRESARPSAQEMAKAFNPDRSKMQVDPRRLYLNKSECLWYIDDPAGGLRRATAEEETFIANNVYGSQAVRRCAASNR